MTGIWRERTQALVFTLVLVCGFLLGVAGTSWAATVVEFWDPLGRPIMNDLVAEYNRTHTDVQIKLVTGAGSLAAAGNSDKFVVAVAAGTPPDAIVQDSAGLWAGINYNLYEPLDQLAAKTGVGQQTWVPFAWDRVNVSGHLYALPFTADARAMYLNSGMFLAAGLSPDESGLPNLATVDQVAKKLTIAKGDGNWKQVGFIPWWGNWAPSGWCWNFGCDIYNYATDTLTLNSKKMIESLAWQQSYATYLPFEASANWYNAGDRLRTDELAMRIETGPYGAGLRKGRPDLDFNIIPVPHPAGGRRTTWSGMWALSIPRGAKHPQEAWDFINWLSGPYAQAKYGQAAGEIPSTRRADKAFSPIGPDKVFLELLSVAIGEPYFPEWGDIWGELVGPVTKQAFTFAATPQALMDDLQRRYEAKIKERVARQNSGK